MAPYLKEDAKDKDRLCRWHDFFVGVTKYGNPLPTDERTDNAIRKKSLLTAREETARQLCADPTEANFKRMVEADMQIYNATCRIYTNRFEKKFKYQGSNSWLSSSSSGSACGEISIATLKKNSAEKDDDWIYYHKWIYARSGATSCPPEAPSVQYEREPAVKAVPRHCEWVHLH